MNQWMNAIRGTAQLAGQAAGKTRHGIVSGYDPSTYAIKVTIQPDNVVTGWIPLKSAWVGNGWGMFCPPSIGDLVEIDYQEGNAGVGSGGLRFFNDSDRPLPCPSGEFWLVHQSGSFQKFHNDGSVELVSAGNLSATVGGNLTVTSTGAASVTAGSAVIKAASVVIKNSGAAIQSLINALFLNWATTHVHSNGNGGANTGAPTSTPPANVQTSILQAE